MHAQNDSDSKLATITLAQAVDYSAGSIVSKVLLKSAAGNVTLFSFDAGQGLSEHTAPFDAMVQVLDGTGHFTVGGQELDVQAGQMIVMPANVPHAVQAVQRFKMLLTMVKS